MVQHSLVLSKHTDLKRFSLTIFGSGNFVALYDYFSFFWDCIALMWLYFNFQFVIYVYLNCDHMEHCRKRSSGLCGLGLPAMGKSPAKWIKTVLFGKKSSKPNLSKGREVRT